MESNELIWEGPTVWQAGGLILNDSCLCTSRISRKRFTRWASKRLLQPELCDWLLQVNMHGYAPEAFIDAIDDILEPQATLCSWGKNKTLDVTKYLRKKFPADPRTSRQLSGTNKQ